MDKFVATYDLLYCLVDNIKNRRLLCSLCLTSKTFNACFTPFLYRRLDIHLITSPLNPGSYVDALGDAPICKALASMFDNPNLVHVRELDIWSRVVDEDEPFMKEREDADGPQVQLLCNLIGKMRSLQRVRMDAWFGVCLLPLLSLSPRLFDSLSLYCSQVHDDVLIGFESQITSSLRAFTNLRSLSFRDLGGRALLDGSDIVAVLLANPLLEELALEYSFKAPHDPRCRWNAVDYIHSICDQYREGNGIPLKLKKLHIGSFLPSTGDLLALAESLSGYERKAQSNSPETAALYLDWLCDVSTLEEVAFINPGEAWRYVVPNSPISESARFSWETFTVLRAPRLRRVRFWELDKDLTDWLERCVVPPGGYGSRVALSCTSGFDKICGYYSTGLGFDIDPQVKFLTRYFKGNWQPSELEVWLAGTDFKTLEWIAENATSVESLTINHCCHGTTREQCEMLDYGFYLGKLPRLQVLYYEPLLSRCKHLDENWKYHFLASILDNCSSLRYVKTGVFAWRIIRESKANAKVVRLEQMETAEQQDVELFQYIPGGRTLELQYHPLRHPLWAPKPVDIIRESDSQPKSELVPYGEYKSLTEIGTLEISAWCDEQAQSLFPDSKCHDKLAGQCWMDSKLQRKVAREIANSRKAGGQWKLRFSTISELEELVPGLAEWEFRIADRGGGEALVEFCQGAVARIYKKWVDANQHRWHASLEV